MSLYVQCNANPSSLARATKRPAFATSRLPPVHAIIKYTRYPKSCSVEKRLHLWRFRSTAAYPRPRVAQQSSTLS